MKPDEKNMHEDSKDSGNLMQESNSLQNHQKVKAIQNFFPKRYFSHEINQGLLVNENFDCDFFISIPHNTKEQNLLETNIKEWKDLTESLISDFSCKIISEDFSKTLVYATESQYQTIASEISKFLNPNSNDIKISPHVMEFVRHSKKFSDLEITAGDEIWIRNIKKPHLMELKKEIIKVASQSYLLDENQYKLLSEDKEILKNVEKKFQVKGHIFSANISLVVQVNQLASISWILRSESENVPVDKFIILDMKKPSNEYQMIHEVSDYKISKRVPWNVPINQMVHAEILPSFSEENMITLFEDCIKNIDFSSPFTVLGIQSHFQSTLSWEMFVSDLVSSVKNLSESLKSTQLYIMLIAENDEILKIQDTFEKKEEWQKNCQQKYLRWIRLVNYTDKPENLECAFNDFLKEFEKISLSSIKIPIEDFADVFFFKDLHWVIPNIFQQLDNKKEKFYFFYLSAEEKNKLNSLVLEVKKNIYREQVNIVQPVSSDVLDFCLLKARQIYSLIRFIVTNSGQSVVIESLDWKLAQEARYSLEVWLGKKIPIPVAKDRFKQNDSVQNFSKNSEAVSLFIPTPSSTQYSAKNEDFIQNSQDISCFQTENGLLVKIYPGNILNANVDGIVNAANKYLQHYGGVARAIIDAAGIDVHTEGQHKLNGRTLDDGEVLSTSAGNLKHYKSIIHAVGPVYFNKNDDYCYRKILKAIYNSLIKANELNLSSIAIPAISSAIFQVPLDVCVKGYFEGVDKFCQEKKTNRLLKEIHFVDKNPTQCMAIKNYFAKQLKKIPMENATNDVHQS